MGKLGMRANEDREKVVSKRLDRAFGSVCALLVGRYVLDDDLVLLEEPHKGFGAFVVEDLELELMAEVLEELIRARECRAQAGFSAGWEKLGMDVGLVLGNHDVLRSVECGDREASSEIGEQGFSAELG